MSKHKTKGLKHSSTLSAAKDISTGNWISQSDAARIRGVSPQAISDLVQKGRRFHAPCTSSASFSRPTHTVCDLGPFPICGPSIRNFRFQGLVGPYPHDAPWGDADSDGELFGHLRRCCLGASQGEDRIRIRCCSSSVMAPDCNHHLNRCVDFS